MVACNAKNLTFIAAQLGLDGGEKIPGGTTPMGCLQAEEVDEVSCGKDGVRTEVRAQNG